MSDLFSSGARWEDTLHYNLATGDPMWQPMDGPPTYIGELEPSHRVHLYRWMLRRASNITANITFSWMVGPFAPRGEMACDALEQICDDIADDPKAWLKETPFMMALAALILGDGNKEVLTERLLYG